MHEGGSGVSTRRAGGVRTPANGSGADGGAEELQLGRSSEGFVFDGINFGCGFDMGVSASIPRFSVERHVAYERNGGLQGITRGSCRASLCLIWQSIGGSCLKQWTRTFPHNIAPSLSQPFHIWQISQMSLAPGLVAEIQSTLLLGEEADQAAGDGHRGTWLNTHRNVLEKWCCRVKCSC